MATRWVAAGLVCVAGLGAATEAEADVVNPNEAVWSLFAIPGFSTGAFSIGMAAGIGGYYDDPGWLEAGNYVAGGLSATSGVIYTVWGATTDYREARHVFLPVGGANLGLAVANMVLAATSGSPGGGEQPLPMTPVISAEAGGWQASFAGRF